MFRQLRNSVNEDPGERVTGSGTCVDRDDQSLVAAADASVPAVSTPINARTAAG